jgi:glutamyl-tRNA(Gln) amidotransferase subunit D
MIIDTAVEEKVGLIKTYPESREVLSCLIDKGYKGVIIEGTGLGHAPISMHDEIERGIEEGVFFGMTSQCIHGMVNMNVYRGGRVLRKMGVVPLGDMLSETAWCKLCFALGHYSSPDEIRGFMLSNIAGEITERSHVDEYNYCR